MAKAFNIPGEGFEPDREPATANTHTGEAGAAAPKDGELGNHENSGPNPEQKHFEN